MRAAQHRVKLVAFLTTNRRLMVLLALFIGGVTIGCLLFSSSYRTLTPVLKPLLTWQAAEAGWAGCAQRWLSACLLPFLLLCVLFLAGLSSCGAPVVLLIPAFFGLGFGVTEAYYYALGGIGVAYVALLELIPTLPALLALLMGSAEAMRLSLLFGSQLLPSSARCGGMWADFKLYLARFLICIALVAVAGTLEVGLKLLFIGHFL